MTRDPTAQAACPSLSGRMIITGSAGFFVATVLFRSWALGRPAVFMSDESYYTNDALDLVTHGVEKTFVGHPPLGKWLIGIGYLSGRFTPVTWRLAALVAGALVVALAFAIAARISGSVGVGIAAGTLVFADGIAYTTGRAALLDGFVALVTTALLAVLVFTSQSPLRTRTVIVVGALCGSALAVKWSTVPAILVALGMVIWRARREGGSERAVIVAMTVTGVAMLAYFGSYAGWLIGGSTSGNCLDPSCNRTLAARLVHLPKIQGDILHSELAVTRLYRVESPGWRWVIQDRPFVLHDERCAGAEGVVCRRDGPARVRVVAKGNVVLWLSSLPALAAWYVRRRHGLPTTVGAGFVGLWALVLWLQFAPFPNTYTYYAAPIVPALATATVIATRDLLSARVRPLVFGAGLFLALLAFASSDVGLPWTV